MCICRGWRRNVDMVASISAIFAHIHVSTFLIDLTVFGMYMTMVMASISCYFLARSSTDLDIASKYHRSLHHVCFPFDL